MSAARALAAVLAALGRHAPGGYAAALVAGLALPGLAAAFRPLLPVTIVLFIALAFARGDAAGVRAALARPLALVGGAAWTVLVPPALVAAALALVGREAAGHGLTLGLALVAGAPPLMATPVYAALLGLPSGPALALLVLCTALTPLTGPLAAGLVAGEAVPLDPAALGLRVLGLLALAALGGFVLRRTLGEARLREARLPLDGLNVAIFFTFAVAAMDGVPAALATSPAKVLGYLAAALAFCGAGLVTALVLARGLAPEARLVLGLGTALRNSGLLFAALGSTAPRDAYLLFSVMQVPIYAAPLLLGPLARRALR